MNTFDYSRVITTGASGMIGSYVDFGTRPDSATLDILDETSVLQYVTAHQPRAIIHLAGATDVERCEKEPLYGYELNVRGTYNIARAAHAVGATLVYASTSRIFKGEKKTPYDEDDIPDPTTQYGRTKHMSELIVAAVAPRHIIARTVWVFGGGSERDNKFYGKVLKQLQAGGDIVALDDVYGSPTYGKDYINAVKDLLARGESGIFHIANAGVATRFDIARRLAEQLKSNVDVRAVDRNFFTSGASLPTNESVVSKRITLRPWQEALTEYVENEWAIHLH